MSAAVRIDLDRPLEPLAVGGPATLVALVGGAVAGEVAVPGPAELSPAAQLRLLEDGLGDGLRRRLLERAFAAAVRAPRVRPGWPVTVVVVARAGGEALERCLAGVERLRTPADEVLVREHGTGWPGLLERAGNPFVALVDDGVVPDPGWLDDLGGVFADPLVVAALGYAAPRGPGADPSAVVHDGASIDPEPAAVDPAGTARRLARGESLVLRRRFAAPLGAALAGHDWEARLLRAALEDGRRVVEDPRRLVWRASAGMTLPDAPGAQRPAPRVVAAVRPGELPPVSVVVPSYNRRERLTALLLALAAQNAAAGSFEVVVALDGSTDGSAEAVAAMALPFRCRVLELPNRGVAAARNAGVRAAEHDLLINLDDDMVPEPALVVTHAHAHARSDGRLVTVGYARPVLSGGEGAWGLYQRAAWEDHYRRKAEPDHPWTYFDFSVGNSALSRSLLESVGGFDEAMRRHDDQECGMRLASAGASFRYEPAAVAAHSIRAELGAGLKEIRAQAEHDVRLGERHPQIRGRLALFAMSRPDGPLSPRSALFFRRRRLADAALRAGPAAERAARAARRRALERRLCRDLSAVAYVRGLRDSFGSLGELEAYLAPVRAERPPALPVDLAAPAPLALPVAGGRLTLELSFEGHSLAAIEALEPAREWSWADVSARAAEAMTGPSREVVPLERLLELSRSASAPGR